MSNARSQFNELLRMVPRLAILALIAGGATNLVSNSMASPEPIMTSKVLTGGRIAKPNGVGFVLAVGLQRAG